jgi:outer membrane protein TolC
VLGIPLALAGCSFIPQGTGQERSRLAAANRGYGTPFERRNLPALPLEPTWRDVLHRAFLTSGELEALYFDWKAALERVPVAAAYPNTNLMVGYSYAFSSESMKTFDRMTFSTAFDSMENLSLPPKVAQAARVALDEARTAGQRFRAAKFDLQQRVLSDWTDYALLAEKTRLQREQVGLLRLMFETASNRLRAGGSSNETLQLQIALYTAENDLNNTQAELAAAGAELAAMLALPPRSPPPPPAALPEPRPLPVDDAALFALAVDRNPQLSVLARQVQGRRDALELARLQWLPDINPSLAFTGGVMQVIGASVVLPTTFAEIRGAIAESRAMLRASQAMLRQARQDQAAAFVATLVALRNSERQAALLQTQILPVAQHLLENLRRAYATDSVVFADVLEAQRTLVDLRLAIAEVRAEREKLLAGIESLTGTDVETLAAPTPQQSVREASPSPLSTSTSELSEGI